jgi:hypothetical protein
VTDPNSLILGVGNIVSNLGVAFVLFHCRIPNQLVCRTLLQATTILNIQFLSSTMLNRECMRNQKI